MADPFEEALGAGAAPEKPTDPFEALLAEPLDNKGDAFEAALAPKPSEGIVADTLHGTMESLDKPFKAVREGVFKPAEEYLSKKYEEQDKESPWLAKGVISPALAVTKMVGGMVEPKALALTGASIFGSPLVAAAASAYFATQAGKAFLNQVPEAWKLYQAGDWHTLGKVLPEDVLTAAAAAGAGTHAIGKFGGVFSPKTASALDAVRPAGVSGIKARGKYGEPLNPLEPPDPALRTEANARLVADAGTDQPQGIADVVRAMKNIKDPVMVTVDPAAEVPRTERLPEGGWQVTVPPGTEPWRVAHEVAQHAGEEEGAIAHDNNSITARLIADMRARAEPTVEPELAPPATEQATSSRGPFTGKITKAALENWYGVTIREVARQSVDDPKWEAIPNKEGHHFPTEGVNGLLGFDMKNMAEILEHPEPEVAPEAPPTGNATVYHSLKNEHLRDAEATGYLDPSKYAEGKIYVSPKGSAAAAKELGIEHRPIPGETEIPLTVPRSWLKPVDGYTDFTVDQRIPIRQSYVSDEALLRYQKGGPMASTDGAPIAGSPEVVRVAADKAFLDRVNEKLPQEWREGFEGSKLSKFADSLRLDKRMESVFERVGRSLNPKAYTDAAFVDAIYRGKGAAAQAMTMFLQNADVIKVRQFFDKMPEQERVDFIDNYKLGLPQYDYASAPDPVTGEWKLDTEKTVAAQTIGKWEDHWYDMMADAMLKAQGLDPAKFPKGTELPEGASLIPYLQNHLALLYEKTPISDSTIATILSKRPFAGSRGALKAMVYESMTAAKEAGLKPISTNPMVLMEARLADNMKLVGAIKTVSNLDRVGGSMLVNPAKDIIPEGWRRLTGAGSDLIAPIGTKSGLARIFEPNTAMMLERYLSYDVVRNSALGKGALAVKNLTTTLELGLSMFHATFVSSAAIASEAGLAFRKIGEARSIGDIGSAFKSLGQSILAPMRYYDSGADLFRQMGKGAEWMKENPDIAAKVDRLFESGFKMEHGSRLLERSFTESLKKSMETGDALGVMMKALPALQEKSFGWIFDRIVPNMKVGAFMSEWGHLLNEYATDIQNNVVSESALGRRALEQVENRFGQMNWDNLFWTKTANSTMQLFFRSLTWKLGNVRSLAGAASTAEFYDPVDYLKRRVMGKPDAVRGPMNSKMSGDLAFVMGTLLTNAVLASIVQSVSARNGAPALGQDENGMFSPQMLGKDLMTPRIGGVDPGTGAENRINIPTYSREFLAQARIAGGIAGAPGGNMSDLREMVRYVASGTPGVANRLFEALQNKDFYNDRVYNPDDPGILAGVKMLGHVVNPMPISGQSFAKTIGQGGSVPMAAAGFVGMTKTGASYWSTPLDEWIHDQTADRAQPLESENAKIRDAGRRVMRATARGTTDEEAEAMLTPDAINKAKARAQEASLERRLDRFGIEALILDAWPRATPDQKAELFPLIQKKFGSQHKNAAHEVLSTGEFSPRAQRIQAGMLAIQNEMAQQQASSSWPAVQ